MFQEANNLLKEVNFILHEGMRGGIVIGHTSSGVPIYAGRTSGISKTEIVRLSCHIATQLKSLKKTDVDSIAKYVNIECARLGIYSGKIKKNIAMQVLKRVR